MNYKVNASTQYALAIHNGLIYNNKEIKLEKFERIEADENKKSYFSLALLSNNNNTLCSLVVWFFTGEKSVLKEYKIFNNIDNCERNFSLIEKRLKFKWRT